MNRKFQDLHNDEDIKSENDFLKMKMMLERGAEFGSVTDLDPEMENAFLRSVMAFEEQMESDKKIRLYDKIDKPLIFKPVAEVSDGEIEAALDCLLNWLSEYGIEVSVCNPAISQHELYRFIIEELFEFEIDDIDLPGWVNSFCYDEFHPDAAYETSTAAEDDCIRQILNKDPFDWLTHFKEGHIRLNGHCKLTEEEFKMRINNFKNAYDEIVSNGISEVKCEIKENTSIVTGNYSVQLTHAGQKQLLTGKWLVAFETDDHFYWYINNVQLDGIDF
ncbi:MAG: hypothetical protein ABIT58_11295 [Ferruginibacter sp.]